jgi:hypothetical protein
VSYPLFYRPVWDWRGLLIRVVIFCRTDACLVGEVDDGLGGLPVRAGNAEETIPGLAAGEAWMDGCFGVFNCQASLTK